MDLTPSFFAIGKYFARWACLAVGSLCLVAASARAGSVSTTQCYDTFLNSWHPTNNNGGSTTFFTGRSGEGGIMRALIRCDLPAAIDERATVTQVTLTLTTAGLGPTGTANGTPATETLNALTEPWGEGTGFGATTTTYTVGQACNAGEATWSQRLCMIANWTTAGGTVAAGVSASASSPGLIGAAVVFSSSAGSGMALDIQNWVASPASNYGWRISSSTEFVSGQAQRFYSKENGAAQPTLAINYGCKPGFQDTGNGCTACSSAAQAACVTSQPGNSCVDPGPPSGYSCTCGNPAYTGTGTGSCTDLNACIPNHCVDNGDSAALCIDHAAPATGYGCSCSAGYVFDGTSCSACPSEAQAACVTSQPGNTCMGSSLAAYTCTCNNAAYTGTGTPFCTDRNECIPNHCIDAGDTGALCIDHAAPATGYDCSCDAGFVFNATTCSDLIFADGFDG